MDSSRNKNKRAFAHIRIPLDRKTIACLVYTLTTYFHVSLLSKRELAHQETRLSLVLTTESTLIYTPHMRKYEDLTNMRLENQKAE